jgi:DNA-binding CsgD family transcriptional regulator
MNNKVDFIPKEWVDYRVYFDHECKNLVTNQIDLSKFIVSNYFYLYINPSNLNVYNVSPNIKDLIYLAKGEVPRHVTEFLSYIHPDDFEFIEFAEQWGFEKIISLKKIDKYKINYIIRFKISDDAYEYFHHQTYYEVNPSNNKIQCCIAFNTRLIGLGKEVDRTKRIVKLLDVDTLGVVDTTAFYPLEHPLISSLTVREKEIIILITRGLSNNLIADKLNISFNTVRTHHSNINKKLNVKNTAELINRCKEIGFI